MKLKIIFSLFILAFLSTNAVFAVPAIPSPVEITQPDGTKLKVYLKGNAFLNYRTTLDGYLLTTDAEGFLCYAQENNGNVVATNVRASDISHRSSKEATLLQKIDKGAVINLYQAINQKKAMELKAAIDQRTTLFPNTGSPKALVLLVEFKDLKFSRTHEETKQMFENMLSQPGYSHNGATGSVLDYFTDSSNGLFTPQFDVYGPVTLSRDVAYYGENTGEGVSDIRPWQMVIDACRLLDDEINFKDYDTDGDGEIDNVFVFYAGYGEAQGGPSYTIWPHKFEVQQTVRLDGVRLRNYACANELNGYEGTEMTGLGTFAHEFCHVMGLPDLYQVNSLAGQSYTSGQWSIIDVGSYLNESRTPPAFSTYERYVMGWVDPVELTDAANIVLEEISKSQGYIIKTPTNKNEFFILENRQRTGWDKYLPGHGMLIWHIDYLWSAWLGNSVNDNPNHLRVDLMEANGQVKWSSDGSTRHSDPFPGTANKKDFTDTTTPNMISWASGKLNKPITNIREIDGKIYFKFKGGVFLDDQVTAKEATGVNHDTFIANWEAKSGKTNYYVDVYQKKESGEIIKIEGLDDVSVGNVTSYQVTGLNHAEKYYYVVRAILGDGETKNSQEISLTTEPTPFFLKVPTATKASDITNTSFSANWETMDEAVSYQITVKERKDIIRSDNQDFTNPIPYSWETTGEMISNAPFFGENAPALKIRKGRSYITSDTYPGRINKFTFWYNGSQEEANQNGQILVYVHLRGSGNQINHVATVDVTRTEGGQTYTLEIPAVVDADMARLVYESNVQSNFAAVDDIVLEYEDIEGVGVLPYVDYEAGSSTAITIEGLKPNTEYSYTITGFNGQNRSSASNEIIVKTDARGISSEESEKSTYSIIDNIIYIHLQNVPVQVFNMQGQMLINIKSSETGIEMNKGIYILKIGQKAYKILIK